jgi:CRISPR/Cas system CSM-associated protein Csm2 small subunit
MKKGRKKGRKEEESDGLIEVMEELFEKTGILS